MNKSKRVSLEQAAQILNVLKRSLSKKTFLHVTSTAKTAVMLAGRFGADKDKAKIAGLLHDCAKDMTHKELSEAIAKHRVKISSHDRRIPAIWHGLIGEQIASKGFKIKDREILSAVRRHSTGGGNMGKLEKIVYVADFIEPRRKYAESRKLRRLLNKDIKLDYLVLCVLREKVKYLKQNDLMVHHSTNLLLKQLNKIKRRR